jgi:hypothetical protein
MTQFNFQTDFVTEQSRLEEARLENWRKIKHKGKLSERKILIATDPEFDILIGLPGRRRNLENLVHIDAGLQIGEVRTELEWILLILARNSHLLAGYTKNRECIDKSIRRGNFHEAKRVITDTINTFGWSFSLLERWIAIHLKLREDASVTTVASKILSADIDPIAKFVVAAQTYRLNPAIPSEYYRRLAEANVRLTKTDESTRTYIRCLIGSCTTEELASDQLVSRILYSFGSLSSIDQYEMLLSLVLKAEIFTKDPIVSHSLISGLSVLLKKIDDYQLRWIAKPRETGISPAALFSPLGIQSISRLHDYFEFGDATDLFKSAFSPENETEAALLSLSDWLIRQPNNVFTEIASAFVNTYSGITSHKDIYLLVARFDPATRESIDRARERYASTPFDPIDARSLLSKMQITELLESLVIFLERDTASLSTLEIAERIVTLHKHAGTVFGILSANTSLLKILSDKQLTAESDIIVLLAFSYISNSRMEISIRIEELLDSLGLINPSELHAHLSPDFQALFPSFVTDVCTLDQLEHLPLVGHREEDVIRERLSLLRQVSESFEGKKNQVQAEIALLVKQERLLSMARIMDASRLLVDVAAIEAKVKGFFEGGETLIISRDLHFSDLHQIFLGVFLLDEEHGLDAELSNRIRHGKLRERLLSPFTANHLLSDTPQHLAENAAFNPEGSNTSETQARVVNHLEHFASEIHTQVNHLGEEQAQLKVIDLSWKGFPGLLTAKTAPEGLICVSRLKEESYLIFKEALLDMGDPEDIDVILRECTESIWVALEIQLNEARGFITGGLFDSLAEELSELEKNLSTVVLGISHEPFTRCRSQLRIVCDEVAGWFVRPTQAVLPTSRLDDVSELAKLAVETCGWGPFDLNINPAVGSIMIPSALVGEMYDVFVLLYSNVAKHGEIVNPCRIYMDFEKEARIVISNTGRETLQDDVNEAKRLLDLAMKGANREALNREGKSGMGKLVRQLRRIDRKKDVDVDVNGFGAKFNLVFSCRAISRS